jgi:ribosomal protein S27AE
LSNRVTAYSAATTWGWLRFLLFIAIIGGALWFGTRLHDGQTLGHVAAGALGLVMAGAVAFAYPRCPRCRHHVFGRNEDGSRRLFRPRQRCGKCNLDLTRYSPADPRAKKE